MIGLGLFNLSAGLAHPAPPLPYAVRAVVAAGRVAQGGGSGSGSGNDLASRIGEHSYYCIGKGFCTPTAGSFLGGELNLDTIVMTVISMAIVLLLALLVRARLSVDRPRSVQNVLEFAFEFVNAQVADTLGASRGQSIGPLAVALFMFILIANWIGLIATPFHWWHSPTSDLNTTLALALLVIVIVHTLGVRRFGGRYVRHVFEYPALAPITLIEEIAKVITLPMRLFGNIFAGEVLVLVFGSLLAGILTVALPLAHAFALGLGLFIGGIQAFIFTVLTVAYIGISTGAQSQEGEATTHH